MFEVTLGQKVRDVQSGFEGTVFARCDYIHDCNNIGVVSNSLHNGEPVRCWFPEGNLETIE